MAAAPGHRPHSTAATESLPAHTSEIGTLKKLPNRGTAWLGSSSGVYFVNTVRRAFAAAFSTSNGAQPVPESEDILTANDNSSTSLASTDGLDEVLLRALGALPSLESAIELVKSFFKSWHPLFPFLHGPTFLGYMQQLYPRPDGVTASTKTRIRRPLTLRRRAIFQLIVNIAALDDDNASLLPSDSRINSTADVTRLAGALALNHDIETIQILLAAELYLVATISLRQASTVAGMTLRLIYHSGLHRCPLRYAQLSAEDCEIRKRIFWSAYALDRHLSISLGDPNNIQDSDIDVCLSGRELHKPVPHALLRSFVAHMPGPVTSSQDQSPEDPRIARDTPEGMERLQREAAITAYVHYSRLIGRIIEIFHKSIHARFPKEDDITFLRSDIDTWWNDLPGFLTGEKNSSSTAQQQQLSPFFAILFQQLLLLLNRPSLSLDRKSAGFQHGLQICIRASRATLAALKSHKALGQSMFLPGLLSANWMAGLIVAFACQLGKYPKTRACADIEVSLSLLEATMSSRGSMAKHCHKVLSLFLDNIKSRRSSNDDFLSVIQSGTVTPTNPQENSLPEKKRRRISRTTKPKKGFSDHSSTLPSDTLGNQSETNVTTYSASPVDGPLFDETQFQPSDTSGMNDSFDTHLLQNNEYQDSDTLGFMYGGPLDLPTFFDGLSEPSVYAPDPNMSNFDVNMGDIFGSATWENLANGSADPFFWADPTT